MAARAGEVHVYSDDASTIERSIIIDGRSQYPQIDCVEQKIFTFLETSFHAFRRRLLNTRSGSGADV